MTPQKTVEEQEEEREREELYKEPSLRKRVSALEKSIDKLEKLLRDTVVAIRKHLAITDDIDKRLVLVIKAQDDLIAVLTQAFSNRGWDSAPIEKLRVAVKEEPEK